ncbi:DUF2914 domain-containing protein [Candidatus Kaiserbacteria bacterium]|nr:DUF2914 domain-containing protein [Candidatus Kaiserbacteria bacterium]
MRRPKLPQLPRSIEEAAHWYMRYVSPLTLVAALIIDTLFLLRRVDTLLTSFVLFFYLALAAAMCVLIASVQAGRLRQPWLLRVTPALPVLSQYAFGGLFIAFLSLYSRSAALSLSWIFVAALALLLIANERFVRFYLRFAFQVSILFIALFSFLIFYLPLLFGKIGPYMFIGSGVASLLAIAAFLVLQSYVVPDLVRRERTASARSIAAIFLVFNVLYFTNAIPPLPLALKEGGVYHKVERVDHEYRLYAEGVAWYEGYLRYNTTFHRAKGEFVYVYTAIFAPTGLATAVSHEWQRYDEARRDWTTAQVVPYEIVGGREEGYRGYSFYREAEDGRWRVNVLTEHGQLIGRASFTVVNVSEPVPLVLVVR